MVTGDLTAKTPGILAGYVNDASFTWNIPAFKLNDQTIGPWTFVQQNNDNLEPKPILELLEVEPTKGFPQTKDLAEILADNRKWADRLSKEILADHDLLSVNIEDLGKSFRPVLQAMEGKFQTAEGYTVTALAFSTIAHMNQINAGKLSVQADNYRMIVKKQTLDHENTEGLKF